MNNRIYYTIIFIGSVLIIDFFSGIFIKDHFIKIKFGDIGSVNKAINNKSDLFIVGSSRAKHHYNSKLISSITDMETYNSGLGGYGLLYNYALISEKINFSKPDIIILDISPNVIVDQKSYDKLDFLIPFSSYYKSFNEITNINSKSNYLAKKINLLMYNSTLYDVFRNFFYIDDFNQGYDPIDGSINLEAIKLLNYSGERIDTNKINYFQKIIDLCIEKKINLICITSPTFKKFDIGNKILNEFKKISDTNGVIFWDYSNDKEFYNNELFFKDQLHLNSNGADKFSKIIANRINSL